MDSAQAERLLDTGDKEALQNVLRWLSQLAAGGHLERALWTRFSQHEQRDIRTDALLAVSRLDRAQALELLPLWAHDADPLLRRRTATWFLITDDAPARAAAVAYAHDADANIRMQAARWLARSDEPACRVALVELALDHDTAVMRAALESLRERPGGVLLYCLAALQRRTSSRHQEAAKRILNELPPAQFPEWAREGLDWLEAAGIPVDAEDAHALLNYGNSEWLTSLQRRRDAPDWLREAQVLRDGSLCAGDSDALSRLFAACDDAAQRVRERAVAMLALQDDSDPGRVLSPLLKHPRSDVRQLALSLVQKNAGRILPRVRNALTDLDVNIRSKAFEILAHFMPENALAVWLRAMRDEDAGLRAWALERVLELPFGPAVRETLMKTARNRDAALRNRAAEVLAANAVYHSRLARVYEETLAARLEAEAPPPEIVLALVKAVGETCPAGAVDVLLKVAHGKLAVPRRHAINILLAKPSRISLMAAAQLASVEDPDALRRVAEFMAGRADPRGLIPLLRALDECPGAGAKLTQFLKMYPQLKQIRTLLKLLKERWPSVKRFAVRALIELESPEMIEPLLAATKDPDVEVQRAAVQALAKFAKRPEVEKRLIELRDKCPDETTRQNAIAMLLGIDPASVIEPLLQATRDEDLEVQYAAVQALGKYAQRPEVTRRLIELIDYGDISVREKAMETLGEYKVKEAVEPLIRFLGNPFLKFRAQEALMRIGDRKGILAIKRYKIREKLFGKKKTKGPVAPLLRKGKRGRSP